MHPAVARNLSLDTVPCPDPYVERLLDGVAFLCARTRLKVDAERSRFSRSRARRALSRSRHAGAGDGMVVLKPGQQVQTMLAGHVVKRGTRLVSGLRPGLSTRCTYTTAQDMTLWPIEIARSAYFQDRSALAAAGIGPIGGAGRRGRAAGDACADRKGSSANWRSTGSTSTSRPHQGAAAVRRDFRRRRRRRRTAGAQEASGWRRLPGPRWSGMRDDEALMPRTRPSFEGYRLLREYFVMPERFHYARGPGLAAGGAQMRRRSSRSSCCSAVRRPNSPT